MENLHNVFLLMGGIGLFLFGINYMSAALSIAAGDNLRVWLNKLTRKPYMAVIVGALVTAAIQSSGAVMVMTVGFVNAQMMNLYQALYVMLGAAIGTTITAQIIAFDIAPIAPLILFIGMVMYLFVKKRIVKRIGGIILGFGLLFVGIYLMGEAVDKMQLGHFVESFLNDVSNPFLQFLFGFIFTFIIQSSSASVGILQVIVASSAGIAFNLGDVVYMILGMNVGALSPLIISSLGGNRGAKRATLTQVASRLFSVIAFVLIILVVPAGLDWIAGLSPNDPSRQIANIHLIFNVVGCIVLFPFIKPMGDLSMKLMPNDPDSEYEARKLLYVNSDYDKALANDKNTAVILEQINKEILRYASIAVKNLRLAVKAFFDHSANDLESIFDREETLDELKKEIDAVLMRVYSKRLSDRDAHRVAEMFNVVSDFERIGDHANNIAEYERDMSDMKVMMTSEGERDLRRIADKTLEMMEVALQVYVNEDKDLLKRAEEIENEVDDLERILIDNHTSRLMEGICEPRGGIIYTDMVTDLERCSDHAMNIAEAILSYVD